MTVCAPHALLGGHGRIAFGYSIGKAGKDSRQRVPVLRRTLLSKDDPRSLSHTLMLMSSIRSVAKALNGKGKPK